MRILLLILCLILPFAAHAQNEEADRGFLAGLLEDNLSSAGRQVTITGFSGALSSRAMIEQITIADDEGIWLTLREVVLDWSRASLLRGRLSVTELTAGEIIVARPPVGGESAAPSPEATDFSLPDLPVSVEIGRLAAERLELGAPVLGTEIVATLEASASLAGGEGQATLSAQRIDDGPEGQVQLTGSYSNETRVLALELSAAESENGMITQLLGLPGAPALDLQVNGTGPITDYAADIRLATDGVDRLAGNVTVQGDAAAGRSFTAQLGGDVVPLFLPDYAEFFGPDVQLDAAGARAPDGRLDLSRLSLVTQALTLQGNVVIAADGLPERIALSGRIAAEDGTPVLLPLTTEQETRIDSADLTVDYDVTQGEAWTANVRLAGLDRNDFDADLLQIDGTGRITRTDGAATVDGTLRYAAEGLRPADEDLATALGPQIGGTARFSWLEGGDGLQLPEVTLEGSGYGLTADLLLEGISTGLNVTADATARFGDLSRFSGLAGRPLAGAGSATLSGQYGLLGGSFDAQGTVQGTDLSIGQAEVDGLLRGASQIGFSIARTTEGTTLRNLDVTATTLRATASGTVATAGSDITADVDFSDLSVLGAQYRGGLTGQARFTGTPEAGTVSLDARGNGLGIGQPQADALLNGASTVALEADLDNGGLVLREAVVNAKTLRLSATGRLATEGSDLAADLAFADLSVLGSGYRGALNATATFAGTPQNATITAEAQGRSLAIGQAEADRLLAGQSDLSVALRLEDGAVKIDRAQLSNPQVTVDANGAAAGDQRQVTLDARLANLGLLLPQFPGAVTVRGTAAETPSGYQIDLRAQGPGQINLRTAGTAAGDFSRANLTIAGTAQAALADAFIEPRTVSGPLRFDLRLNGPLALSSLAGRVSLAGGRFADPQLGLAIAGIAASADLAGGRAQISVDGAPTEGGRLGVSGSIDLAAPYSADLTADIRRVILKDPELYQTKATGLVTVRGPLTGGAMIAGRIDLEDTELRIPSTGLGGSAGLDQLQHVNEPAPVRATRQRAQLIDDGENGGGGSSARPFGLDLTIGSRDQIFVRGRGLDAELGGEVRLAGTTANVIPSGAFNLIRGRLDILGKRLVLSEALLQLQGDFVPYVRVVASTENDGITTSVVIEGRANEPEVSFTSSPELPEEEIISRLLFGRGLDTISPLQAAQLASAVATLAGRGGDGIIGKLRQGFGLDDLDIVTDAEGDASLRAGKYISDNVYTEVEVDAQGQSRINLNLDVTSSITLRGSAGGDGGTGIGVFIEKDY